MQPMKHPNRGVLPPIRQLENDTIINVSRLLQEGVGAVRYFDLTLDWFALDTDLMARDITGQVRLMRINDGLLLTGTVDGIAMVECVRCLEIYDQPFKADLEQEYRPMLDISLRRFTASEESGEPDESLEDIAEIDETHELDLAEPLRQFAILALPIKPICGDDCPGLGVEDPDEGVGDHRLSVLGELLDESPDAG